MDLHLRDQVVIITGGAKGIGRAIALAFAAEGAIPCIVGRSPAEADALVATIAAAGGSAAAFPCELTEPTAIAAAVENIVARFGRIDVLVHNAGVNDGVGLDAGIAAFRTSLERNLVHVYELTRLCLPQLTAAKGAIVNIGSKCSITGQGGTNGYAAAKGAMNSLTREWGVELAPRGIRVNCVLPAEVMTPQYAHWISSRPDPDAALAAIRATIPLGQRMTTAEEIADTVVFVASPRSSHTTGQLLYVDGGYIHFDRAVTHPGASA
ncbi:SDR family oxidoreductase [Synoicihabitans lomoniglobus]|uniref:SDR family oxidoreductase n=1 Tax=Synoicihabitans lomoniglobus TaxID=2909285 RepID=A0AAE9ZUC8_9BACT|nr:SDR family oxidoreductase [Opitutaceae bacterium LMO-M01]WED64257.1 SDR family oxidoreductase [Opitutaceae bacterium LMO-M01]